MSVLEVVAAILRAQVAQVAQQRAVALALIHRLTGARDVLHAAMTGAASPEAARSVQALSEAVRALQRALKHLDAVVEHIAAYGPALGVDLRLGAPESTEGATGTGPPSQAGGEAREILAVPRQVQRAADSLPQREGGRGPTQGRLLGADLQPIKAAAVRSGEDLSLTADLDLPPRERLSRSLTSHVEAHIAA